MKTTATKKTDTNSFAPYVNIGDIFEQDDNFYQVVKITPTGRATLKRLECNIEQRPDWRYASPIPDQFVNDDWWTLVGKIIIELEKGREAMISINPRGHFSLRKWDNSHHHYSKGAVPLYPK